MSENKTPNLIDRHIGRRVRWRRRELKYSQEHLGSLVGLTFQQIQKYENGTNRISSGRLFNIAQALDTAVTYFYEGAEELDAAASKSSAEVPEDRLTELIDSDAVDLVVAFKSITDPKLRKSILLMVSRSARAKPGEWETGGEAAAKEDSSLRARPARSGARFLNLD